MSDYVDKAIKARTAIEQAMNRLLDDRETSENPNLLPRMRYTGEAIQAGTRIQWGNTIKKAAVTLWDREDNDPDHDPTLWVDIQYHDGVRIIPDADIFTVTEAFAKDELGWERTNDEFFKSKFDGNVYHPRIVPTNWEVAEGLVN